MNKFLLAFLTITLLASPINSSENRKAVQEALELTNNDFASSIQIDLLKNCSHVIPTLANWVYEEWRFFDASLTREQLINSFVSRLNDDQIPLTFVALKNEMPVGVISVKKETAPELSDFPEDTIWMGSLCVIPEEKNQGVDEKLLSFAKSVAKQFGYDKLYLYISNPSSVDWYVKKGAQIIEERPFRNHIIAIMYFPLET